MIENDFLIKLKMAEDEHKGIYRRYCPNCNGRVKELEVKKPGLNNGRPFMICESCKERGASYFWWLDYGNCDCGAPLVKGIVKKEGKNKGRTYVVCATGAPCYFRFLTAAKK
jgi:hypothetical protein